MIYDVLLIGQATAKASARDSIEPWDPAITAGLQECMHRFGRIDNNIELRPILDSLAARPPLASALSEETKARLPLGARAGPLGALERVRRQAVATRSTAHSGSVQRQERRDCALTQGRLGHSWCSARE